MATMESDPNAFSPVKDIAAPGQKIDGPLLQNMRREVAELLGRNSISFPGAQPVSFARKHLEELTRQDYYVCEKSDGMRYLLYLTQGDENEELHYLIDRRNDFWALPPLRTHFPIPRDHAAFHTNTLIDGELVIDTSRDGTIQPKYLVFDCMVLDGNSLMNRTLDKRLAYFKERIFQPYEALLKEFPQEIPYMHFIVELKAMQFGYAMEMMFRQILPSLPHGNDGLIFTCRMTDYKPGTDPHILKWKPEHENSIDFRLSLGFPLVQPDEQDMAEGITKPYLDYDAVPICDLHVYNGDNTRADTWYGNMHIEEPEWENLKALQEPLEDRIVECFMDPEGRWRFMRWRDDKKEANHISTVESVIESIRDRVTKEDLIAAAKGIRDEWKRREKKEAEKKRAGSAGAGTVPMQVKRKADEQGNGRPSPGPPGKS